MYDGKQVVRVATQYKKADLYNIGVEMTNRKGTGNYDKERTKYNVNYVSLNETNLYQEIKQHLKKKNIEFNNKPSTNLLNGITITSGPEFFQSLGMKFKDSGRKYYTGDKKGQSVLVPDIQNDKDIPNAVTYFFDSCMDFLKDYVGEENILLAQVHYDEDTPHLQAYFVPVVDKVKRKCYVKDKDGKVVKEEVIKKDGTTTTVPKLLRDQNGKIVYEEISGKFLNCDQFWKDRGGKLSFHQMQNKFQELITEKGFNLYRGDIGANKENQTKLEYDISEKKAELEELNKEKENTLKIIENSKERLKNARETQDENKVLNPTKTILGYKEKDIIEIIDYAKDLKQEVTVLSADNTNKDILIKKLNDENETFKNNSELIKRNEIIKNQKTTILTQKKEISRLNDLVGILNNSIEDIKSKFEKEITKLKRILNKVCKAIDKLLGRDKPKEYLEDYEDIADAVNYGYYSKNNDNEKDKDDFEIGL